VNDVFGAVRAALLRRIGIFVVVVRVNVVVVVAVRFTGN
jgi:hypothetical protein